MKTTISVTFALLAATALLSAAFATPSSTPSPTDASKAASVAAKAVQVTIDNFSFKPATLTVTVGTKVTWTNHDDVPHTVVSTNGKFKSSALDTNAKFSYTFRTKGTYTYFCSVHPVMTAKVIVH